MTPSHTIRRYAAIAGALVLSACTTSTPPPETAASPASPPTAYRLLTPVEKARADSARLPYTVADIRFMQGMLHHHAQAISMSRWAPTHGASPAVLRLSGRIINAQQDEITAMQHWLGDRNQEVPEASPTGMKMKMNGMEHEMLMPGMLSADQMARLDKARGGEFDRLFLTFMIQHHKGAVSMVRELFGTTGAGQDETIFKFANDVGVDQGTEIERMQSMLAALPQ